MDEWGGHLIVFVYFESSLSLERQSTSNDNLVKENHLPPKKSTK
jgi:hypothetical protein